MRSILLVASAALLACTTGVSVSPTGGAGGASDSSTSTERATVATASSSSSGAADDCANTWITATIDEDQMTLADPCPFSPPGAIGATADFVNGDLHVLGCDAEGRVIELAMVSGEASAQEYDVGGDEAAMTAPGFVLKLTSTAPVGGVLIGDFHGLLSDGGALLDFSGTFRVCRTADQTSD